MSILYKNILAIFILDEKIQNIEYEAFFLIIRIYIGYKTIKSTNLNGNLNRFIHIIIIIFLLYKY